MGRDAQTFSPPCLYPPHAYRTPMIKIETESERDVLDITQEVQREVEASGIKEGLALIHTLHTTTAIIVNEGEAGLRQDLMDQMDRLLPNGGYRHGENGPSHIQAALLGNSAVLPVERGRLLLGTWQQILFLELDGPRMRQVGVRVISA
ncbi:MAG: hypothetical protein A4E45_02292 [Methanosaeta sp. PtaB.Bin039]|nr:MAG: hypothetical protein A4E45_02292 [Methanosaeta sp. PtaB.Bin039]OPY46631.1 MAG: hypothetical protein A4E47_00537 [Methanosaeta sp. PtaU1.Bin028]